jgi:hypothetical protein
VDAGRAGESATGRRDLAFRGKTRADAHLIAHVLQMRYSHPTRKITRAQAFHYPSACLGLFATGTCPMWTVLARRFRMGFVAFDEGFTYRLRVSSGACVLRSGWDILKLAQH